MKKITVKTKTKTITIDENGDIQTMDHKNPRKSSGIFVEYKDTYFKVTKS